MCQPARSSGSGSATSNKHHLAARRQPTHSLLSRSSLSTTPKLTRRSRESKFCSPGGPFGALPFIHPSVQPHAAPPTHQPITPTAANPPSPQEAATTPIDMILHAMGWAEPSFANACTQAARRGLSLVLISPGIHAGI
ncbi:uncharacterized protein BKA78DRAFT_322828 [Phyllosticta capitalensis]|uniref:uncharacterized protein n=1 Tax=Phyllosticta capitalensis TaxID=121624 RepID=UPI0031305F7C